MACNADDRGDCSSPAEHRASFAGGNIMGRQMHAMCPASERYVYARIDQQARLRSLRKGACNALTNSFQVPAAEVFFAQLNVIDSGSRALRNFFQQARFLSYAITGKL